jgi:hypothetical protein
MTSEARALAGALALVEHLGQEIRDLHSALAELERRVAEMTAENRALYDPLDESRCQAAPFDAATPRKSPRPVASGPAVPSDIRAPPAPSRIRLGRGLPSNPAGTSLQWQPRAATSFLGCRCRTSPEFLAEDNRLGS